jgi:DNA-binding response OmpR family regulator
MQSISDFLLSGADEYLAKPFQVHELVAAVDRVTGPAAPA